jgi:poly-gamma-glutamate synthase PgsB/CapB
MLIVLGITSGLILWWLVEYQLHLRALNGIPVRVHVNGTRGKSSVVRLIAAGLREAGMNVIAKTTGSAPMVIHSDGTHSPIRRIGPANIREQIAFFRNANRAGAQVAVVECMAIKPPLQWTSEHRLVRSHIGVITNVREDHLDEMGPTVYDVATSISLSIPRKGDLFIGDDGFSDIFTKRAASMGTDVHRISYGSELDEPLQSLPYVEHAQNVACALAVCEFLGVGNGTAIEGMKKVVPDPGALSISKVSYFEKSLDFVNAFAANDPQSTLQIWERLDLQSNPESPLIVILNLRGDRPHRALQFGKFVAKDLSADYYIVTGPLSRATIHEIVSLGMPEDKLFDMGEARPEEIFERALTLTPTTSTVVGIGNIVGRGEEIATYFHNRSK